MLVIKSSSHQFASHHDSKEDASAQFSMESKSYYLLWKHLQPALENVDVDVAVAAIVSGDDATGTFTDGTVFTATGESDYISVNVDNGTCVGSYYVSYSASLHHLNGNLLLHWWQTCCVGKICNTNLLMGMQVTSGGPILGVSKSNSSGSTTSASLSIVALLSILAITLCIGIQ